MTMKHRTFIYISGPYRGTAPHDHKGYFIIDNNINNARMAAATLAKLGIPYFCPHLNSAHFEVIVPEVDPKFWLDMDMVFVDRASALWLLPDWQNSRGTAVEVLRAKELGIPMFKPWELKELTTLWQGLDH